MSIKRAQSGSAEEKNPLAGVEISDEDTLKLVGIQKDLQRAELLVDRQAQALLVPVYEKRRPILKAISKFWPVALTNQSVFAFHVQHSADQLALTYLEDVWIARDPVEMRCYTVEFYFKENPYFSDSVLKKEYKYMPPPAAANETPDADGITPSMLDFSWERDVKPSAAKINWKDADKALTKLYPRVASEEEDELSDAGSFFNLFEIEEDPFELGVTIANEIFPEAIDFFMGQGEDIDSDEEDSDDSNEAEIDLEKPVSKKRKV
ncbi:hypothetical protein C8J56DRAFT_917945 [Mycena floridula]|nr:hypothetical protein C8J56DRAFT_917945 [Mycena floridula]